MIEPVCRFLSRFACDKLSVAHVGQKALARKKYSPKRFRITLEHTSFLPGRDLRAEAFDFVQKGKTRAKHATSMLSYLLLIRSPTIDHFQEFFQLSASRDVSSMHQKSKSPSK